jgi:hypothetical protein
MADLVVKTGVGLSVGVALSVIMFKRPSPCHERCLSGAKRSTS